MSVTFLLVDQSSPHFLLKPAGAIVNQVCFRFLLFRLVFKIFVVKVESCTKSGQIFDFLVLQNFSGAGPQKSE